MKKRFINALKKIICPKDKENSKNEWKGSSDYWENRYLKGDNSGSGSYGRLAEFKAEIINTFVKENDISSVIEWGCGDGNQLQLANYTHYVGFDVSKEAIRICMEMFKNDINKKFVYCGTKGFSTDEMAELTLSLDVIYHLIEDDVYDDYMKHLFDSATRFVCIYSCNDDIQIPAQHVKHRKFTDWIEANVSTNWRLKNIINNKYPYDPNEKDSSWSDFYFYEKI